MKRLAVVGAEKRAGYEVLQRLAEYNLKFDVVYAVAFDNGKLQVSFGDETLNIAHFKDFDFSKVDLALLVGQFDSDFESVIATINAEVQILMYGSTLDKYTVVDSRSISRKHIAMARDMGEPLAIADYVSSDTAYIISKFTSKFPIQYMSCSSLMSMSYMGADAMDELFMQTKAHFINHDMQMKHLPRKIAFNIIPHIGSFMSSSSTDVEERMRRELRELSHTPNLEMFSTCTFVPTFVGGSQVLHIKVKGDIDLDWLWEEFNKEEDIICARPDNPSSYITTLEAKNEDHICISRLRKNPHDCKMVSMWISSDNLKRMAKLVVDTLYLFVMGEEKKLLSAGDECMVHDCCA